VSLSTIVEERTAPAEITAARAARRPRWWLEALLVLWLAWVYDVVNNLAPLRRVVPYSHALAMLRLERRFRLDPETSLNGWMAAHHTTGWLAANYYDTAHYIVTFGLIAVLWWRRPDLYRPLRTGLALINVIGFLMFWGYPMAPPRLVPGQHFVDVVTTTHAFGSSHSGRLAHAANELAAMPSLHISWALWSALVVWRMYRHRRWAALVWAYPLFTALIVLATGNHFLVDVLAGGLTMVIAQLLSQGWYAWRAPRVAMPRQRLAPD
jgi:hypothetical protein